MTSRRRAPSANGATIPAKKTLIPTPPPQSSSETSPENPKITISPSKWTKIVSLSSLLLLPYAYLLLIHFKIDGELKRSILINAALSFAGFFLTLRLIPVASRYVTRRNLFGFDINKKGTPQGNIKVLVSLNCVVLDYSLLDY